MNTSAKLRLTPGLRVSCLSGNEFLLETDGRQVHGGAYTLALLDAFRSPRSMTEVLQDFGARLTGAHDWMELSGQLLLLHKQRVLVDDSAAQVSLSADASFGSPAIHIRMLNDRERTLRYLQAIRDVVKPGDVVVDLGTGSGILAVAAARAGARQVYAIEATTIARAARRTFADNGVTDRVTLIEGHSTQVQLPERADVLVAEIIGNKPLSEKILESTADAVRRFLKPGARLVPQRLRIHAFPVELPARFRDRLRVSPTALADWQREYGVDFSALAALSQRTPGSLEAKPVDVAQWNALAPSKCIVDYDLSLSTQPRQKAAATFECCAAGTLDAAVLWFDAELAAGQSLSTDPGSFRADNHWSHPVYLLGEPLSLQLGDRVRLEIEDGNPTPVLARRIEGDEA